jgi:hypothetical protein
MPAMIDAHPYAYGSEVSMQSTEALGEPYGTAHAVRMFGHLRYAVITCCSVTPVLNCLSMKS